jgi:hypothetical protein
VSSTDCVQDWPKQIGAPVESALRSRRCFNIAARHRSLAHPLAAREGWGCVWFKPTLKGGDTSGIRAQGGSGLDRGDRRRPRLPRAAYKGAGGDGGGLLPLEPDRGPGLRHQPLHLLALRGGRREYGVKFTANPGSGGCGRIQSQSRGGLVGGVPAMPDD